MFLGDSTAQYFEGRDTVDGSRLAIGTIFQGCISAPMFATWFRFLDRTVQAKGGRGVLAKVVVNQIVAPVPQNAGYMAFASTFEAVAQNRFDRQAVAAEISSKLRHNLVPVIMSSALFWIPVNTLNFAFCPPQYRILPSIIGGCLWGWYISYKQHHPV